MYICFDNILIKFTYPKLMEKEIKKFFKGFENKVCSKNKDVFNVYIEFSSICDLKYIYPHRRSIDDEYKCCIFHSEASLYYKERLAKITIFEGDYICNGRKLNINVLYFLITEIFSRILMSFGYYPIHASGVVKKGKAILFTGMSNVGKTTTALRFLSEGYKLISDDRVFVRDNVVVGFPKPVNISNDSVSFYQSSLKNINFDKNRLGKTYISFNKTSEHFAMGKYDIKGIYILNNSNSSFDSIKIDIITAIENLYRINSLFYAESEFSQLMDICIQLAKIDVFHIDISNELKWFEKLFISVEENIKS